jgi:hypothetical protein
MRKKYEREKKKLQEREQNKMITKSSAKHP